MNRYYLGLKRVRISWLILSFFFMFSLSLQAKEINSTINKNQPDSSVCEVDLKSKIYDILKQEELCRSHWGILVS